MAATICMAAPLIAARIHPVSRATVQQRTVPLCQTFAAACRVLLRRVPAPAWLSAPGHA